MILRHFSIQNVRGLQVESALERGLPLVVTGGPVSGKTSLLEAIAGAKESAGAYGMRPTSREFQTAPEARVTLQLELAPDEVQAAQVGPDYTIDWDLAKVSSPPAAPALTNWLARFDYSPSCWKMEYFHAGRALSESAERAESSTRLTRQPNKYGFVRSYLQHLVQEEAARALDGLKVDGVVMADLTGRPRSRFSNALNLLAPMLRWDGCETGSNGRDPVWFVRPTGPRVELSQLAESERAAVLIAASWSALGLERSLVLIDHPEQGLHPERHAAFFDGLRALMVDGQLIATTTSPAILRMLSTKQVLVLQ